MQQEQREVVRVQDPVQGLNYSWVGLVSFFGVFIEIITSSDNGKLSRHT